MTNWEVSTPALASYVEVQEAYGMARANKYLKAGYVLIDVQPTARLKLAADASKQPFVKRQPVFVLGRAADVEPLMLDEAAS